MGTPRLIVGQPSVLEYTLADVIATARDGDPLAPVTVLCGSTLLKPYLARTLASQGIPLINVRFVMPDELATTLEAETGDARPRLTPGAQRLLVRLVAESNDGYFRAIASGDGFARALRLLFRELDRGGFSDESSFGTACAAAGFTNHPKLDALVTMYAEYVQRRGAFRTAEQALARASAGAFEGPLLIYGMPDPPELTLQLIERVAVSSDATAFVADVDYAIPSALSARLIASGATIEFPHGTASPTEQFAAHLFARERNGPPADAPTIALVSAADTVREVWEAARQCLQWAREGIAFHEMAIVYRNADPYAELTDEIFTEARIPTYLHEGRRVSRHPLGRLLLSLLDLAASDEFSRRGVMEFLTETRLSSDVASRYGTPRTSEWESFTRQAGIVAGIDQWTQRLTRLAGERRERARAEDFAWMADVADRIDVLIAFATDFHTALAARWPDQATWEEHLAYVRQLAEAYCPAAMPVVDALGDLSALGTVAPRVRFERFCQSARDDLDNRDVTRVLGEPTRAFGKQGVSVLDAMSVRYLRFRAVYLLGVAERAWPPPPRPDPLLLEHERTAVNITKLGQLPLRTEPDDEPATFQLASGAARERLTISYARAEAGGSGRHLPSYFFRAAAETLLGTPLGLDQLASSGIVQRFEAGRLACDDRGASLTAAEYDRSLIRTMIAGDEPSARAALAELDPSFGRAAAAHRARWSGALTAYDGVLSAPDALARSTAEAFASKKPVSPTRLEMYATCGYRYFMRYGLGVEPAAEPETIERIDALERGSLIHAILERFLTACGRDDPPRVDARTRHLDALREVAEIEYREREIRGVTGLPLIWSVDRQRIGDDLVRWYDEEVSESAATALRPGDFEVGFGGAGYALGPQGALSTETPLTLDAAGRQLLVQGRMDRLDWDDARTRFRVIDYKTGKRGEKSSTFGGGKKLQLALYLRAAAELLGIDPLHGEAQYFYVTRTGGYHRDGITGSVLAARDEDLGSVLRTISDGVDGGYFAPNPGTARTNCTFCDYRNLCDGRIDRIMERKAGDPRGDAYRALEAIL